MDFIFNDVGHRLVIALKGVLEEDFKISDAIYKFLNLNKHISEIVFVLRKLEGYTEPGIKSWLGEISKLAEDNYLLTFIECPREIVEPLFLHSELQLKSFIVPYYCDNCSEEYQQIIDTNSLSMSFASYTKPLCPSCNKQLNIDITENEIEKLLSVLPVEVKFNEHRKYSRFNAVVYNIKVKVSSEKGSNIYMLINFSEVGLCIAGDKLLPLNMDLDFEVDYKGKKTKVKGSVVWYYKENNYKYFMGVSLENREIFYALINS